MDYSPFYLQKQISAILYVEYLKSGMPQSVVTSLVKRSSSSIAKLTSSLEYTEGISDEGKRKIEDLVTSTIADIKLNKSVKESILDTLSNVLLKKTPTAENNTKVLKSSAGKFQSIAEYVASTKILRDTKGKFQSKKAYEEDLRASSSLRDTKGRFQSVTKLTNLIQNALHDTLEKNMQKPALVYRTGRFAKSVEIKHLAYDSRTNSLKAFLTYMKYPYQTFEPGFVQGNIVARNPKLLIDKSMREIAVSLTKARMQTVIV